MSLPAPPLSRQIGEGVPHLAVPLAVLPVVLGGIPVAVRLRLRPCFGLHRVSGRQDDVPGRVRDGFRQVERRQRGVGKPVPGLRAVDLRGPVGEPAAQRGRVAAGVRGFGVCRVYATASVPRSRL